VAQKVSPWDFQPGFSDSVDFPSFRLGSFVGADYIPLNLNRMGIIQWSLVAVGATVVLWALRLWLRLNSTYHIGRAAFRIRIFGLTVRRIPFSDIERVSKLRRHYRWSELEDWTNTLSASRREMVLHRRSGLFRKLVITPQHRYEFRTQIRAAIAAETGRTLEPESESESDAESEGDRERE
jgi:hypothetical protein